jgi:hypothetical protein
MWKFAQTNKIQLPRYRRYWFLSNVFIENSKKFWNLKLNLCKEKMQQFPFQIPSILVGPMPMGQMWTRPCQ